MFNNLPKPDINWKLYLDDFFDSRTKYKVFYSSIRKDYIHSHLNYDQSCADFNIISPLDLRKYTQNPNDVDHKINTLKNLYLSKTSYFCDLLDELRSKNELQSCPNCGEDGSPNTLDHYLPKVTYPELSVCIYNLIPMCSKCQSEKSTDYKGVNNNKLFFHPYYDNYTEDMYILEFLPSPTYKTPRISIKVRNQLPSEIRELAMSQFNELNLSLRFNSFITQTYGTAVENLLDTNMDVNSLLEIFIRMHLKKGVNNWNVILYKSMLENPNFISWIVSGRLRKNLGILDNY